MSFFKEFKEFAIKGNVIDLAVGVIIGAAFGKIVSSMVSDLIMPVTGILTGGMDFKDLKVVLKRGIPESTAPDGTINPAIPENALLYGNFIQNVVDFLIVAICVFVMVKVLNIHKRKHEAAKPPAPPTETEKILSDIRELLRKQANA